MPGGSPCVGSHSHAASCQLFDICRVAMQRSWFLPATTLTEGEREFSGNIIGSLQGSSTENQVRNKKHNTAEIKPAEKSALGLSEKELFTTQLLFRTIVMIGVKTTVMGFAVGWRD